MISFKLGRVVEILFQQICDGTFGATKRAIRENAILRFVFGNIKWRIVVFIGAPKTGRFFVEQTVFIEIDFQSFQLGIDVFDRDVFVCVVMFVSADFTNGFGIICTCTRGDRTGIVVCTKIGVLIGHDVRNDWVV